MTKIRIAVAETFAKNVTLYAVYFIHVKMKVPIYPGIAGAFWKILEKLGEFQASLALENHKH